MHSTKFGIVSMSTVLVTMALLAACGSTSNTSAAGGSSSQKPSTHSTKHNKQAPPKNAVKSEKPVPVESNPPGDIPDSTAFVPYRSSKGHFEIKIPEGWSRRQTGSAVTFTSKLNVVTIQWGAASSPPSVQRARSKDVRSLQHTVGAFQLEGIKNVSLPGGKAVLLTYRANSKPNAVTGKQYRLDVLRFELFRKGEQADVILSSPVGADNVDPWRIVSESFKWV